MTSAIARWHSSARPPSDALELAYADRLEAEMQELAIQLHKVNGESRAGTSEMARGFWRQRPAEKDTAGARTVRAGSMTAPP